MEKCRGLFNSPSLKTDTFFFRTQKKPLRNMPKSEKKMSETIPFDNPKILEGEKIQAASKFGRIQLQYH